MKGDGRKETGKKENSGECMFLRIEYTVYTCICTYGRTYTHIRTRVCASLYARA